MYKNEFRDPKKMENYHIGWGMGDYDSKDYQL